ALEDPFVVAAVSFHLDVHVGISHYPNHATTISDLVRTSAFACHLARQQHSHYSTFDKELDEWERHRFRLLTDLNQALKERSGIQLAYQPLINLKSGICEGMEGLCRWHHSELGDIAPGDFLPYVEQTPLIMSLTESTMDLGLENLARWSKDGFTGSLAINLSPALFRHPGLLERLQDLFRFHNISPERVHFEITESGIIEQPNRAVNTLNELRSWGSRISVDDFGTGHSSLAYLADLPIDTIKIDKHFIKHLSRPWNEAIVGATAMLADKLGLGCVAEGIEEESQLQKCRDLGVTLGQGFFIGKPMLQQAFGNWIDSRQEAVSSLNRDA
ncbi:MAG: GGDEF domain-containing phosphodiesterase, partial [Pseudohongiellaceae bacterium]